MSFAGYSEISVEMTDVTHVTLFGAHFCGWCRWNFTTHLVLN